MIAWWHLQAAVSKATGKLGPIQEVVKSVAAGGAGELLSLACAPPLTWNVLKALLLVMGKTADQMDTWLKCRSAAATCLVLHIIMHDWGSCIWHVQVTLLHVVHICLMSTVTANTLNPKPCSTEGSTQQHTFRRADKRKRQTDTHGYLHAHTCLPMYSLATQILEAFTRLPKEACCHASI